MQCLFILKSRLQISGSEVNRVHCKLFYYVFSVILFCFIQTKTSCRYGCMYFLAALVLLSVDETTWTGALVGGMSAVYMLNSVGESTLPYGTPVFNSCCQDVWFLYVVSPDVLYDELSGILYLDCNIFLISLCMFIVLKYLPILSWTPLLRCCWMCVDCRAVTVECCVCTCVARVCLVCLLLCKE